MCAKGGTGGWHSEVVFVSENPKGPYTPAPNNPIQSQRYLVLEKTEQGESKVIASRKIDSKKPIQLQVKADGDNY